MYDKECEADENKIWIKDDIKPQQISNHTTSYSVVIPKWKRETKKKKERNTSLFHMNLRAHCMWWNLSLTVADPDLQIMEGSGWGARSPVIRTSRPWDKWEAKSQAKSFTALRASVCSKNKGRGGGGEPPGPSPGSAIDWDSNSLLCDWTPSYCSFIKSSCMRISQIRRIIFSFLTFLSWFFGRWRLKSWKSVISFGPLWVRLTQLLKWTGVLFSCWGLGSKELLCNLVSERADKGFVLIAPFNILTLTNSHDADLDKRRLLCAFGRSRAPSTEKRVDVGSFLTYEISRTCF